MGAEPNTKVTLSFRDYVQWDLEQEERHEFFDGEVFAMAGGTEDHDLVCLNVLAELRQHLRGKGCRAYTSNMKVQIRLKHAEVGYYPDAMVVCDPEDRERLFKTRPRVIVEVMSDFRRDQVEKFMVYQHLDSLEDYLVINQDPAAPKAWIYRRTTGWDQETVEPGGIVELPSIGFRIPLAALYEG
jgi:Uma2 family endonuclease